MYIPLGGVFFSIIGAVSMAVNGDFLGMCWAISSALWALNCFILEN